jgi:hypothetical protein
MLWCLNSHLVHGMYKFILYITFHNFFKLGSEEDIDHWMERKGSQKFVLDRDAGDFTR